MNLKEIEPDQIPYLTNFIVVEKDSEIPIDWNRGYIVFKKISESEASIVGLVCSNGLNIDKSFFTGSGMSLNSLLRPFGRKPFLISRDFVTIPECFV